jgi:hypothetical protein
MCNIYSYLQELYKTQYINLLISWEAGMASKIAMSSEYLQGEWKWHIFCHFSQIVLIIFMYHLIRNDA